MASLESTKCVFSKLNKFPQVLGSGFRVSLFTLLTFLALQNSALRSKASVFRQVTPSFQLAFSREVIDCGWSLLSTSLTPSVPGVDYQRLPSNSSMDFTHFVPEEAGAPPIHLQQLFGDLRHFSVLTELIICLQDIRAFSIF